jgi:hypothetical protein
VFAAVWALGRFSSAATSGKNNRTWDGSLFP